MQLRWRQQELSSGKVIWIGREDDGLYILINRGSSSPQQVADNKNTINHSSVNIISSSTSDSEGSSKNKSKIDDISLWHRRLGHAPLKVLKNINGMCKTQLKNHMCSVCLIAKQARVPFFLSTTCSVNPFDIVHADVWGPYRVPTHDGKRYFLTLVDDFSRYT
nr:uncharacterized mitochondrial protein AtMg00300-like [Nicotiana tomentosiformis]